MSGMGQQLALFASAISLVMSKKPALLGLMACRDALNKRFRRGTVRVTAAVPASSHLVPVGRNSRLIWKEKCRGAPRHSQRT